MPKTRSLLLPLLPLFVACNTRVTSNTDSALRARVETVQDCFPGLYARAQTVLDAAKSWRLNDGGAPASPAPTSFAEQTDGSVLVSYNVSGATLTLTVRFYSPAGVPQNLDLGTPATLDELVTTAAVALRAAFPDGDPFVVGAWNLSGAGLSGSGALTGILGGTAQQPELEELRTTSAIPAGGPPPLAAGAIADNGPPACSLTFASPGLQIDRSAAQQYPIGVLNLTIQGPSASVSATLTFDGTSVTRVVVQEISGAFLYDVVARSLTYVQ